ncbi:MAG: hemerythrin domain-containing protein [Actinomycetota bacterium]
MFGELFGPSPTFDDPIGMLKACHRRIERSLVVLGRVADQEEQRPLDEAGRLALQQLLHYFEVGVPRHAADEEQSLFPRLRGLAEPDIRSGAIIEQLELDHQELDEAHRRLNALGEELLRTGRFAAAPHRAEFRRLSKALADTYARHIREEDEELFPLASNTLAREQMDEVGGEMAVRRGLDWSTQREMVAELRSRPWLRAETTSLL